MAKRSRFEEMWAAICRKAGDDEGVSRADIAAIARLYAKYGIWDFELIAWAAVKFGIRNTRGLLKTLQGLALGYTLNEIESGHAGEDKKPDEPTVN